MKNFSIRISDEALYYIDDIKSKYNNNRSKAIESILVEHKKNDLILSKLTKVIKDIVLEETSKTTERVNVVNSNLIKLSNSFEEEV